MLHYDYFLICITAGSKHCVMHGIHANTQPDGAFIISFNKSGFRAFNMFDEARTWS